MNKYLAFTVLSVILAACSSTPKTTADTASADTKQPAVASAPSVSQGNANNLSAKGQASNSIYFDYDKADVKSQFKDAVKQQAEWMRAHKNDVVTLEGNTDERGSDEYNLGLGSRRSAAVRHMLVVMGISGKRIKDVSFGKEKPRAACHEEKCWGQNRRVDFVHKQG